MTALFFDLDGTLFETRHDLAATVNRTREALALKPLPEETVLLSVGRGANYLLEHAIPERSGDDVRKLFFDHYAQECCVRVEPYAGVLDTLKTLASRGCLLGVNTNKPAFAARAILKKFGLDALFGAGVVAGGDGFPLKPDPKSIQACAERLHHTLSADDWMVGDSWTDLECARRAGVRSAFCTFGFGFQEGLNPDATLTAFADLLDAVPSRAA